MIVTGAHGSETDQRRELRAPEGAARWAVVTPDNRIDVGESSGFTVDVAVAGPLFVVNRVCRRLPTEIEILHLREYILEVLNGRDVLEGPVACQAGTAQLICHRGHLRSSGEVVAGTLRIIEVHRFRQIELLEEMTPEATDISCLGNEAPR